MPSVYVASPYGFSIATRGYYDDVVLPALRDAGCELLDPWADDDGVVAAAFAQADQLGEIDRVRALGAIDAGLGAANEALIRDADALFAILDGADVDSGTAAEIGFAAALEKPIIGLRLDTRRTGDNDGTVVNLQVQHFIVTGGGSVWTSLHDAVSALQELLPGA